MDRNTVIKGDVVIVNGKAWDVIDFTPEGEAVCINEDGDELVKPANSFSVIL